MGLRVEIKAQGREGGTLLIKYKTLDQLEGDYAPADEQEVN